MRPTPWAYSHRIATVGSIRLIRRAGNQVARSAAPAMATPASAREIGSPGWTPNSPPPDPSRPRRPPWEPLPSGHPWRGGPGKRRAPGGLRTRCGAGERRRRRPRTRRRRPTGGRRPQWRRPASEPPAGWPPRTRPGPTWGGGSPPAQTDRPTRSPLERRRQRRWAHHRASTGRTCPSFPSGCLGGGRRASVEPERPGPVNGRRRPRLRCACPDRPRRAC